LGVVSPLVGDLEKQGAAPGVVGRFGGANAFLRVLLVEVSERHGSYPSARKGPTPVRRRGRAIGSRMANF
jgi:hypothetical protein